MKLFYWIVVLFSLSTQAESIRVASFNVSMEAGNYIGTDQTPSGKELFDLLAAGEHSQIRNIAEILQRTRPDIVLLNEFDYIAEPNKGVNAFVKNFLMKSQNGAQPIDYPYFFAGPVNTGVSAPEALNHNRNSDSPGNDTFGFGLYPGQYGMLLLSRFPIDSAKVRTFQGFLWRDMPNNKLNDIVDEQGNSWYTDGAKQLLRLSSKSHWDIPVKVAGKTLHILASHPTPPVFDGPEDRNGARNYDEIRFWLDYLSGGETAAYIYDDQGQRGGYTGEPFVILGDLNASPVEGNAMHQAITGLLQHPKVSRFPLPTSKGGKQHSPDNEHGANHTAAWRMMVDYALPSVKGLKVKSNGIFWPTPDTELHRLVVDRAASSDHRLVWVDIEAND